MQTETTPCDVCGQPVSWPLYRALGFIDDRRAPVITERCHRALRRLDLAQPDAALAEDAVRVLLEGLGLDTPTNLAQALRHRAADEAAGAQLCTCGHPAEAHVHQSGECGALTDWATQTECACPAVRVAARDAAQVAAPRALGPPPCTEDGDHYLAQPQVRNGL